MNVSSLRTSRESESPEHSSSVRSSPGMVTLHPARLMYPTSSNPADRQPPTNAAHHTLANDTPSINYEHHLLHDSRTIAPSADHAPPAAYADQPRHGGKNPLITHDVRLGRKLVHVKRSPYTAVRPHSAVAVLTIALTAPVVHRVISLPPSSVGASASIVSDARSPAPPLDIVASPYASSATDACPHTIYAPCDYMRIHGYSLADRLRNGPLLGLNQHS
jgi:hypothetical protein